MSAASVRLGPILHHGQGLGFQLGGEYERKKQKLQTEKKDWTQNEFHLPTVDGLSLPIDDKSSLREKLRQERNAEYNLFLQREAQSRRTRKGASVVAVPPLQTQDPNHYTRPPSRRDAATVTEDTYDEKQIQPKNLRQLRRRRWHKHRGDDPHPPEEDKDGRYDFSNRRRPDRHTPEPGNKGSENPDSEERSLEMPDSMKTAGRSTPCISQDKSELATGLLIGESEKDTVSQWRKEKYRQELLKQIAENKRNRDRAKTLELRVDATGATDPEKEPDRIKHFWPVNKQNDVRSKSSHQDGTEQEVQRSHLHKGSEGGDFMRPAEHRANTGNCQPDSGAHLRTRPGSRSAAPYDDPLTHYWSENYHRDFSNMLGEMARSRAPSLDLPVFYPHNSPVHAPRHHDGTRTPTGPSLPYTQNALLRDAQQSASAPNPSVRPRYQRHVGMEGASPMQFEELLGQKSKQRSESLRSYQEAFRQQLKEREECKKREKEEKERYDAKMEAESLAYNPWGRSGGGAPIRDQQGNLISDLKRMHRLNEESRRNRMSPRAGAQVPYSHQLSGVSDEVRSEQLDVQSKYKKELEQQIEENKRKKAEESERMKREEERLEKKVAEQRAVMKLKYEEERKKQMTKQMSKIQQVVLPSETRQEKIEEKIRLRKERVDVFQRNMEKRSQSRNRCERDPSPPIPTLWNRHGKETRPSSPSSKTERVASSPNDRRPPEGVPELQCVSDEVRSEQLDVQSKYKTELEQQIEENKRKKAEESERMKREEERLEKKVAEQRAVMKLKYEEERKKQMTKRDPSPPIPTLWNRHGKETRPSSPSSKTEREASPPNDRHPPEGVPELQSGQERSVLRKLSALRNYLRNEQTQLEDRVIQKQGKRDNLNSNRIQSTEDTFKPAPKHSTRTSVYRTAPVQRDEDNIRQFNQLKYRDTESREILRSLFPHPPTDGPTLDIQQQALLWEQNRRLITEKYDPNQHYPRTRSGHSGTPRGDTMLPSDTTFLGNGFEAEVDHHGSRPPSAGPGRRRSSQSRSTGDQWAHSSDWRRSESEPDPRLNLKRCNMKEDARPRDHSSRTERLPENDVDYLSLRSALGERCVSTETVATEAWLRPGTSDAVKPFLRRERTNSREDARAGRAQSSV